MKGFTTASLTILQKQGKIKGFTCDKQPAKEKKQPKYKNHKVEYEGEVFDSKKELFRWKQLLLLLRLGEIKELRRQVSYDLNVNGQKIAAYIADHVYADCSTGHTIVEDVKSEMTRKLPVYRLKKKLMMSIHNIDIKEV